MDYLVLSILWVDCSDLGVLKNTMEAGRLRVMWLTVACLWVGGAAQDIAALNNRLLQVKDYQKLSADVTNELESTQKSLEGMKFFWFPDLESPSLKLGGALAARRENLTAECIAGTEKITNSTDPKTGLPLILRMADAMGKIGPGYFEGNVYASGAYDECLDIGPGDTEYCTGDLTLPIKVPPPLLLHPLNLTWNFGMCVPRGCTAEDVALAIEIVTIDLVTAGVGTIHCESTRIPPYSAGAIVMITVCCMFAVIVLGASAFDYFWQVMLNGSGKSGQIQGHSDLESTPLVTKPSWTATMSMKLVKTEEFITAFSLFKVVPQILSTKQPPSAITSINGLRVMSMFWVILGHTYFIALEAGLDNTLRLKDVMGRFSFQAIGNAYFAVDSFFVLSGLLVMYLSMRQMKRKNGRFPFLTYYLHRYLRLTPTYAFVLFFIWFLSRYLANGPKYDSIVGDKSSFYNSCSSYWWTNLLYINNLYPWNLMESCTSWSWYLANDMQFYILSPLIIIPLYFLLPLGIAISAVVILVSMIISGTLAGVYDLQANQLAVFAYNYQSNVSISEGNTYVDLLYIKPWHRVTPYVVGLLLGYVLYRVHPPTKRNVYLNYIVFAIMWILSAVFLTSTLYGLYPQWNGHIPTKAENVVYIMFSKFTWGLGLALLIIICHYGYGGLVNTFLSMSFWIPLSRISYNAYLLHPFIMVVIYGSQQKVIHYQDYTLVVYAIGLTVLSYGAAAVVSVFVEFPVGNLEQAIFKMVGLGRHESTRMGGEETNHGKPTKDSLPYDERSPTLSHGKPVVQNDHEVVQNPA